MYMRIAQFEAWIFARFRFIHTNESNAHGYVQTSATCVHSNRNSWPLMIVYIFITWDGFYDFP